MHNMLKNNDIKIGLIKIPTYGNKKHPTKYHFLLVSLTRCIINQCQISMNTIVYHCVYQKNKSAKSYKIILLADNNDVMTERDYYEALKEDFDMENQAEAFCFNLTLQI